MTLKFAEQGHGIAALSPPNVRLSFDSGAVRQILTDWESTADAGACGDDVAFGSCAGEGLSRLSRQPTDGYLSLACRRNTSIDRRPEPKSAFALSKHPRSEGLYLRPTVDGTNASNTAQMAPR
jgi:hypothetical protein